MRNSLLTIKRQTEARRTSPDARLAALGLCVYLFTAQAVAPRAQTQTPNAAAPASVQTSTVAPGSAERERGMALYQRGDAAGAVAALRDAVKANERDAVAWYYLGLALRSTGVRTEARTAFEKALRADSRLTQARISLATMLLEADKASEVEREAKRVLERERDNPDAQTLIGLIRLRDDKAEAALKSADDALGKAPGHASALLLKGRALLHLYGKTHYALRTQHTLSPQASEDERRKVDELIESETSALRSQMNEVAGQMERVGGQETADSAMWREVSESLRFYSRPLEGRRTSVASLDPAARAQVQKAVIRFKPEPGYTEDARAKCMKGTVSLRLAAAADGTVKYMLPYKTLGRGLTWRALEAARAIKFTPASRDGQPISQWIIVEYNFNCY
ncbi:MAG TPA: energy transducer TonB [Pyrinomonadaceae bacterium]|nr:energy transducer TonB [Pyrinomonadaceae bacterium]